MGGVGLDGSVEAEALAGADDGHGHSAVDLGLTEQVGEGDMEAVIEVDQPIVIDIGVADLGDDIPFPKRSVGRGLTQLLDHHTMNGFVHSEEGTECGLLEVLEDDIQAWAAVVGAAGERFKEQFDVFAGEMELLLSALF